MLLGPLLAQYEEALIAVGEEAESLSFVYRSLKNLSFTDFIFTLQQKVTEEEKEFVEEIYTKLAIIYLPSILLEAQNFVAMFLQLISAC